MLSTDRPKLFFGLHESDFSAERHDRSDADRRNIDESESLVFWLSMTDTNPQYPFLSLKLPKYTGTLPPANPKKYYDFDQTRLTATLAGGAGTLTDVPSFKAKFSGDTFYIYIDSRSYIDLCRISGYGNDSYNSYAYADDSATGIRPYWSTVKNPNATTTLVRDVYKPMNATTFQLTRRSRRRLWLLVK